MPTCAHLAHRVPLREGLFTWPSDEPRLIGVRDRRTGEVRFPAIHHLVPSEHAEEVLLSRTGRLWTWTIQRFAPKSPPFLGSVGGSDAFVPFGVGYVELDELIVEGRLTVSDPGRLRIGMPMQVTVVPLAVAADGTETIVYAFEPVPAR